VAKWFHKNEKLKKWCFKWRLKTENVRMNRRSAGRLFEARGPATAKAQSPMVTLRVAGIRTSPVDAERSWRRETTSDSDVAEPARSDTVMLHCWGGGAQERITCTWCTLVHRASVNSRAAVWRDRTCTHQQWDEQRHSAQTESDQVRNAPVQRRRHCSSQL